MLYLLCTALCLVLSLVFVTVLPDIPLLYAVFFAFTLFFAVFAALAVLTQAAVRAGRFAVMRGTVSKKHEKGICDAGANYIVLACGGTPGKKFTVADLSPAEFRAAAVGRDCYVFSVRVLREKVLCVLPAEEYALAPELEEKLAGRQAPLS